MVYQLQYISSQFQETAELNLVNAKLELSRMAGIVEDMFKRFLLVFHNPDKKMGNEVEDLKQLEEFTDKMQEAISRYLAACARQGLNTKSTINVTAMMRIAHELENIGDSCFNLMVLAQRRYDKKISLNEQALAELTPYIDTVEQFVTFTKEHLNEHLSKVELETAYLYEDKINDYRDRLKFDAQSRLKDGSDVKSELLYIDIVRHIEQIGDHSLNVAQALRQIR